MKKTIGNMPIVRNGSKQFSPYDPAGVDWWLFKAGDVPENDNEIIERMGLYRRYQGPGRPFARRGHVRRVGKRVLVTQCHGWDI